MSFISIYPAIIGLGFTTQKREPAGSPVITNINNNF